MVKNVLRIGYENRKTLSELAELIPHLSEKQILLSMDFHNKLDRYYILHLGKRRDYLIYSSNTGYWLEDSKKKSVMNTPDAEVKRLYSYRDK